MESHSWTPQTTLARIRIRQWWMERTSLQCGKVKNYKAPGRIPDRPNTNRFDAALVRCLDFEKAFGTLTGDQQTLLLMAYRDGQPYRVIARIAGCSERAIGYKLPLALRCLARVLDRRNLL